MNKNLRNLLTLKSFAAGLLTLATFNSYGQSTLGCSDAGLASASADSTCYLSPTTLTLTGYTGNTFQWQSFDGTNWVDETGAGATTDTYSVSLLATTNFRAIVTQTACPPDTSNEVLITVGVIPVPTGNAVTRCGPGIVNLTGTGSGTLEWFTDPTGGSPIATGSNTTAFIPATTTLWLGDNVLGGGGNASEMQIMEFDLGNNDYLEIQNVSPVPVDVTGWKVAINNSYTDINLVNANVQVLSGIIPAGGILTWTDLTTATNYWGSNMLWNPGAFPTFTGWALILDDQNNVMDFVPLNWPAANIAAMNPSILGVPVSPGTIWTGDGVDISSAIATTGVSRVVSTDNNNSADFAITTLSIGTTNAGLVLPFTGFGCNSPRVPVSVTINPSDPITINASATDLCLSGSATFTATSANGGYAYTWSPATGLSSSTGATVTCTPLVTTTYVVIGDDGVCSNVDTVTISVGAPTVPGIASTAQDSICLGKDTDLLLTGSTGDIQWQRFDGSNWIDETGVGFNTATYNVAPLVNTTYRAYVSSGSCPPDSSNILDIVVLSITDPVTTGDSICGGGNVTLTATGQGNITWYANATGGSAINSGGSYTFTASTTTTVYAEAFAGTQYSIGPVTSAIGNQSQTISTDAGLSFDVIRPITLDVVHVYPTQTGNITINLRQTAGGTILATHTQAVTAFTGKVAINLGFSVPVGTGYRLEIAAGSVQCQQNTTGAAYPYTVVGGPMSITGYFNPNPQTGVAYLWMYDWKVSEGCRSNRIPATVVVTPFPSIPTITQNFNTLTSSAPSGNQWLLNGVILVGETGQNLVITQTGNYTVAVTVNGCTTLSPVFNVTFIGVNEIPENSIAIYPNPVSDALNISNNDSRNIYHTLQISDITGRMIYKESLNGNALSSYVVSTRQFAEGVYMLELISDKGTARKRFVIER